MQCPEPYLLPDAQPGVVAYLTTSTQWRFAGMGGRAGMDYGAVVATLRAMLPAWRRDDPATWGGLTVDNLLADVQVIEAAILGADAELAKASRTPAPPELK